MSRHGARELQGSLKPSREQELLRAWYLNHPLHRQGMMEQDGGREMEQDGGTEMQQDGGSQLNSSASLHLVL